MQGLQPTGYPLLIKILGDISTFSITQVCLSVYPLSLFINLFQILSGEKGELESAEVLSHDICANYISTYVILTFCMLITHMFGANKAMNCASISPKLLVNTATMTSRTAT